MYARLANYQNNVTDILHQRNNKKNKNFTNNNEFVVYFLWPIAITNPHGGIIAVPTTTTTIDVDATEAMLKINK